MKKLRIHRLILTLGLSLTRPCRILTPLSEKNSSCFLNNCHRHQLLRTALIINKNNTNIKTELRTKCEHFSHGHDYEFFYLDGFSKALKRSLQR